MGPHEADPSTKILLKSLLQNANVAALAQKLRKPGSFSPISSPQLPVDLASWSGKSHFPPAWQPGVPQCGAGDVESLQSVGVSFWTLINLPWGSKAGVKYRMLLMCPGAGQDLLDTRLWMQIPYLSNEIY